MCTFLTFSYLLFLAGKSERTHSAFWLPPEKGEIRPKVQHPYLHLCILLENVFWDFDEGPGEYPVIHLLARGSWLSQWLTEPNRNLKKNKEETTFQILISGYILDTRNH